MSNEVKKSASDEKSYRIMSQRNGVPGVFTLDVSCGASLRVSTASPLAMHLH